MNIIEALKRIEQKLEKYKENMKRAITEKIKLAQKMEKLERDRKTKGSYSESSVRFLSVVWGLSLIFCFKQDYAQPSEPYNLEKSENDS